MSTITMAVPFRTTVGFSSTSGFEISAAAGPGAAGGGSSKFAVPELQQPEQPQEQRPPISEQGKPAVSPTPSIKTPPTPDASETHTHSIVGWKGLYEISQHSGASGVLGARAAADNNFPSRDVAVELTCTAHTDPTIRRLVKSVVRGLKACQEPEKALDGMGGTYFFLNESGKKAAILKPCDEEPLAPNNPKGYVGRALGDPGWKPTVRVGEAAMREVAAFLLDHENWSRVPTSVLVRARHPIFCYNSLRSADSALDTALLSALRSSNADDDDTVPPTPSTASCLPMKLGSLQEFVQHECDTSEMGPSRFAARDVHRIGILDIRIFNTDRHAGNMLVRMPRASNADLKNRIGDTQYELIPIDHGFCLPETLEAPYFEWLHWPQTLLPFTEDELQYINELDIEKDKAIVRQNLPNLRPECMRVLEVSTTLLQACAAAGLNLFEIASVMTRPFIDVDEEPSELEKICVHAKQCAQFKAEHPELDGASDSESDEEEEEGGECEDVGMVGPLGVAMSLSGSPAAGLSPFIGTIQEEGVDGGEMLFDLDDEANSSSVGGGRALRGSGGSGRSAAMAPRSPSRSPSPGSSPSSSSIDQLSLGGSEDAATPGGLLSSSMHHGMRLGGMGGAVAVGSAASSGMAGAAQPQMARSLHIGDGMSAFNGWCRRSKNHQVQSALMASRRVSRKMSRQMYPPPVVAFPPDSLNGFFSDFTPSLWAEFMGELRREIDEALASGKWKQAAQKDSNIAMSCPRF